MSGLQRTDTELRKAKRDIEVQLEEALEENQNYESEVVSKQKRIRTLEQQVRRLEARSTAGPDEDLWGTLLLPEGASSERVGQHYRKFAFLCHSDKGGAAKLLPRLTLAKEKLATEHLRKIYISDGLDAALEQRFEDIQPKQ